MSLSKQLGLGFFLVLFIVFMSSIWVNVSNTREYIEYQLSSHAQDTATSLGLSIMPHLESEEGLPIIDTMTNAIFDRGYYQEITLYNGEDEVLIRKINTQTLDDVPAWFVDLFTIEAPKSNTELNTGWTIAGRLEVISNPGFGYQQLWSNAKATFSVISIIFVFGLFFVYALVKMITRPLKDVALQAERMSDKHFEKVSRVPKTKELKQFVLAINVMSTKLGKLFMQLNKQSEQYRRFAYSDILTEVGNRRAFDLAFEQLLRDEQHHSQGFLLIIRGTSLQNINEHIGINEGDSYLKKICEETKQICSKHFNHFSIYRIAGADFAVLLEDIEKPKCESLVEALAANFKRIEKSEYQLGTAHIGATEFQYSDNYHAAMERADSALAIAATLPSQWQFASNITIKQSNSEWRGQILQLIDEAKADFAAQPLIMPNSKTEYSEWFARMKRKDTGEMVPMSQLIPASVRLNYSEELDKMLFSNAFALLKAENGRVGLNVSRLSLLSPNFQSWLLSKLNEEPDIAKRLVLEIPERALVNSAQTLNMFAQQLKALGVRITLEHYGAQLAGFIHLKELQPDYLKLDGRFTANIHEQQDNQLFVESLLAIAHGLNIKIIAEMVESSAESDWLKDAGVDFQQGYFIAAPRLVQDGQ